MKNLSKIAWGAMLLGTCILTGCGDDSNPPTAQNDYYSVAANNQLVVQSNFGLLANDSDIGFDNGSVDDDVTVTITNGPARGTLQLQNDGAFVYIPFANQAGAVDQFIYVVENDQGFSSATVTIAIGGNNSFTGVGVNNTVNTNTQFVNGTQVVNSGQTPIYFQKK